jgi:hypothetical protein
LLRPQHLAALAPLRKCGSKGCSCPWHSAHSIEVNGNRYRVPSRRLGCGVVPLAVEFGAFDVDGGYLRSETTNAGVVAGSSSQSTLRPLLGPRRAAKRRPLGPRFADPGPDRLALGKEGVCRSHLLRHDVDPALYHPPLRPAGAGRSAGPRRGARRPQQPPSRRPDGRPRPRDAVTPSSASYSSDSTHS